MPRKKPEPAHETNDLERFVQHYFDLEREKKEAWAVMEEYKKLYEAKVEEAKAHLASHQLIMKDRKENQIFLVIDDWKGVLVKWDVIHGVTLTTVPIA